MKMNQFISNNQTKIEDNLGTFCVLTFLVSTVLNFFHTFSPNGNASFLGSVFSYGYIVAWLVAVGILRNRKDWIWIAFIVRMMTVIAFGTTIVLTFFDLDTKYLICGAIAYIPFGMLYPVYGGLSRALLNSKLFFAIPIGQAIISVALFIRMRFRRTA